VKTHLVVRNIHRNGYEYRVARDAHEVKPISKMQLIADDSRRYHRFQIFELYLRGSEYLRFQIETREFVLGLGLAAHGRGRIMRAIRVLETLRLVRQSFRFCKCKTRARNVDECVLQGLVRRELVFPGAGGIHKFELNVVSQALDVVVAPIFVRVRLGLPAPKIHGPIPGAPGRVRLDRVRLSVFDVDAARSVFQPGTPEAKCSLA